MKQCRAKQPASTGQTMPQKLMSENGFHKIKMINLTCLIMKQTLPWNLQRVVVAQSKASPSQLNSLLWKEQSPRTRFRRVDVDSIEKDKILFCVKHALLLVFLWTHLQIWVLILNRKYPKVRKYQLAGLFVQLVNEKYCCASVLMQHCHTGPKAASQPWE